ncbi:MaoC family dehydratase [Hydrogenophaga sp.]|jgi:acyl dehydratase|uniref:MaoC family dehydratase n=1 Tax=Hydrogenophaga sp. TaxID=1904254 RepID=UPI003F7059DC
MLIIEPPSRLADQVGHTIGPGDWLTVDQAMIDAFAHLTGDRQWIHVDTERAAREMPGGKTIAHGFLVLALLGRLMPPLYEVKGASRILNYGSDRLRFLNVVPAGARVRASITFKSVEPVPGGRKCVTETSIEVEGQSKPALVAESIFLYYD